jgi:hypothetical protein
MDPAPDGGKISLPPVSQRLSSAEVNNDLTMCGLLVQSRKRNEDVLEVI